MKVGDTVKVKSKEFFINHPNYDEEENVVNCGYYFSNEMFDLCGRKDKISFIQGDLITLEYLTYNWNDWMLEKIDKQLELFEEN